MISALRMKSVRTALAMVRFSCSGVNSPASDTSSWASVECPVRRSCTLWAPS